MTLNGYHEPKIPDVGIHENVSHEEYASWVAVNNSSMPSALRSPGHYRHAIASGDREKSDSLNFGTFAHAGRLEPLSVARRYIVMPAFEKSIVGPDGEPYKNPKNTAAYREKVAEFERVNAGKEVVEQKWLDDLDGMVDAMRRNSRANAYLSCDGPSEVSFVWDDPITGLRCKGRADKLYPRAPRITDFKTTDDALNFEKSIVKFGYHRQGAFYSDGLEVLTGERYEFCIVAAEKIAPYGVRAAPLDAGAIEAGRLEYRRALAVLAKSFAANEWPVYENPPAWGIPHWADPVTRPLKLTVGGQPYSFPSGGAM